MRSAGIVGVVPAAGHATRLQPLDRSKEMLDVAGRPVMDFLVDRMRAGGCTRLRVVTRPEKTDVVAHSEELGAEVVLDTPATVSASLAAGMEGLDDETIVLLGFPDTLWSPLDGYARLVGSLDEDCEVALGLFRIDTADLVRSDVVVLDEGRRVTGVDVKPAAPRSEWIWGCAAARASALSALAETEWPGDHFDRLCRLGRVVRGVPLSDVWLDIGTHAALGEAARRFG